MPRYRLTVAYDGTDFVGWQRQAAGTSIQGLIEDALFPFEDRRVIVTGAGRTDAGVHALGQVAAFTLERAVEPGAIVRALNARLPATVRVLAADEVHDRFHPRFDALSKTYRYRMLVGRVVSPFDYRYVWHVPFPLDAAAMTAAAAVLVGEHDFAAFRSAGTETESTVRQLFESRIDAPEAGLKTDATESWRGSLDPLEVWYTARGTGFLRHMVRAIVGSLVEVGLGRRPASWIADVLRSCDRSAAGPTAPASGLCLVAVEYAAPLATQP